MNLYLWTWSFDVNDTNAIDCPTNGTWTNSGAGTPPNVLTYNSGTDTYAITFVPNTLYTRTGIGKIGFLLKAQNGTGDKKSQDVFIEVGLFNINMIAPLVNTSTIINSGGNLNISATNTNGNASYNLKANGTTISSATNVTAFTFNHTNITTNTNYDLEVTQASVTKTSKFSVIVNPGIINQAMGSALIDGINYNTSDPTKATLVLNAPGKDFVYVAGTFNNYSPNGSYSMKKDPTSGKFWLELTGLTSGQMYNYQYWVVDQTPVANSPTLVKTADPYSTLVLSPFDDPWIPALNYPNIPAYPAGQEREVTVLQTNQTPYVWSNATTNFVKPKKEDLLVYEVLVRDFDSNRSYQSLIDKISYFKNLNINAIQLMPVMEFEGNESWGYNTSYHMALDKFYGTQNKFKEFIDLCHANGIAVILDIALNHAFGRNAMNRMWMNDANNDGWGDPASDNPYFNTVARHAYSVGSDFNHQSQLTQDYVKRVAEYWIEEFKIDGYRWDLTKGFTQNCTGSDEGCTGSYQQDRVDVLKEYVDYCWAKDPTHFAIFEHLGGESEEAQWANYRISENPSKGVMMWSEMVTEYNQLASGYSSYPFTSTAVSIDRVGHKSRSSFSGKRIIGYPESHDKDRLMYNAVNSGNSGGTSPLNNVNNALARMSAIGAATWLIPGPKMLWHFSSLGMDDSIYTCSNGTVNTESDPTPGNCKLDTKPQPQWTENWLADANRNKIYNDWRKMLGLKITEAVFEGDYTISTDGSALRQRIYIFDNTLPASQLKNVVVLCNFSVGTLNVNPSFPYTGTWHNLIEGNSINVTNTSATISMPPGSFLVYGNQPNTLLSAKDFEIKEAVSLYPNPANNQFILSVEARNVEIYSITGQLVKTVKGTFDLNTVFDVSELNKGIYIVKVKDAFNRISSTKLIKE